MKRYILIDDRRNLDVDIIIRTPESALEFMDKQDVSEDVVIFDNDLGYETEGWHIMQHMFDIGNYPAEIQLVTSNPVARDRMRSMIEHTGYYMKGNLIFKRKIG